MQLVLQTPPSRTVTKTVRGGGTPAAGSGPADDSRIRVAIVIPARDEVVTIGRVLQTLPSDTAQVRFRTFVCDDGSSDDTAAVAARGGATVLRHGRNIGIGAALTTGFEAARAWTPDIYVQVDADGQHDPRLIPELVGPILRGEADFVIGSRFLHGAGGLEPLRRVGVRFYSRLVRLLGGLKITDVTSGFRAVRADKYDLISVRSQKNWAIEMTLRAGLNRLRTVELFAPYHPRVAGQSQFQVRRLFILYHYRAILQIFRAYTSRGLATPGPPSAREVPKTASHGPSDGWAGPRMSPRTPPSEPKGPAPAGTGHQLSLPLTRTERSQDLPADSRT